jgi:hypothetical protein
MDDGDLEEVMLYAQLRKRGTLRELRGDSRNSFGGGISVFANSTGHIAGQESKIAGFHHYYADDNALEGSMTGAFPDGSVIVDERLEM